MSDVLYQVCTEGEDGSTNILHETYSRDEAERRAMQIGTDCGAIQVFIEEVRYPLHNFY